MDPTELWDRYRRYLCVCGSTGLSVDISRMNFGEELFERMAPAMAQAFDAMEALEAGAIANPDENRRVGHYWLRAPQLAPEPATEEEIQRTLARVKAFAEEVRGGEGCSSRTHRFENLLVVGIGGSALGPQFVSAALGSADDPLGAYFLDNTDPDGFDDTFARIGQGLSRTLVVVISKSGGTVETRNAMLETARRYEDAGLRLAHHAVAVTQTGSALHGRCTSEDWLADFPIWDWVGGRTSVTSAAGMLPAALQGFDVDAILAGAAEMDAVTRNRHVRQNPAALLP
jgi:glucose-6-phosphate isomerase